MTDQAALKEKLIETARLLATPIDIDGLVGDGALARSRGAWYEVLKHELLPTHVWQQAIGIKSDTHDLQKRMFLKFSKRNAAAARLYEKLTGEVFVIASSNGGGGKRPHQKRRRATPTQVMRRVASKARVVDVV